MPHVVRFGSYEADLDSGQLRKCGAKIRLRYQLFQILDLLLEHPGQVISRDDLQRHIWSDEVSVDFENNLNTAIAQLRETLGDSAEHPSFIETLPKRGYRFIADVQEFPEPTTQSGKPLRLVVLPFVNMTGDPAQEYLCDAMTDEVITALASLAPERLAVIARTTAMHYKTTRKEVARIGRELAVDYAVEGAIRRSSHNGELNIQVVRARDETHVFARKYEALWNDLLALQLRAATDIAAQLGMGMRALTLNASHMPTRDLIAYREYIQGRSIAMGTPERTAAALRHFENSIARDPDFTPVLDAIAELYWYQGYLGFMPPRKAFSIGLAHAMRALEIDNTRAEIHALVGQFHKAIDYNWPEVHREMALALRLDPNSPVVLTRYAVSELMPDGRLKEAIETLRRALEFDPLSVWARLWLGITLTLNREFERAVEQGRILLEIDPSSGQGNFVVGVAARYLNRCDEAISSLRRAADLTCDAPMMLGWLGLTFTSCGHSNEAREVLRRLHEKATTGYVPPTCFAWIHLGLRQINTAFQWLDRAVDECDQLIMPIKSYGFLDPIRSDPRFAILLRKMGLEP
ncbi:MAG: winged helix-turn-helix domain-containing protein [Terriglobia bacterium]|jgi:TolB-like protein|nr:winged helix-turn-helix domain-containing protein [Terriglobia bacterium]